MQVMPFTRMSEEYSNALFAQIAHFFAVALAPSISKGGHCASFHMNVPLIYFDFIQSKMIFFLSAPFGYLEWRYRRNRSGIWMQKDTQYLSLVSVYYRFEWTALIFIDI